MRSERTRRAITDAVIEILATSGAANLTHRQVAKASGASLSATTYYFATKDDLIAAASNDLLAGYLGDFDRVIRALRDGGPDSLPQRVVQVIALGVSRRRTRTLAWCEIMLEGARHVQARVHVRAWFERLHELWAQVARLCGVRSDDAATVATGAIDLIVGGLFYGLALDLDATQARSAFIGGLAPHLDLARVSAAAPEPALSRKSAQTRERLLAAAARLVSTSGVGALTLRAVAAEAGLSPAAPSYHFASPQALAVAAQQALLLRSRERYRAAMSRPRDIVGHADLADLTSIIHERELTEFGTENIAGLSTWLETARRPELRSPLVRAVDVLSAGWARAFTRLPPEAGAAAGAMAQYLFVGSMVRTLACGATAADLAALRSAMRADVAALAHGRHWMQTPGLQGAPVSPGPRRV